LYNGFKLFNVSDILLTFFAVSIACRIGLDASTDSEKKLRIRSAEKLSHSTARHQNRKRQRTSDPSNLTKRAHRRRTWTIQSYSQGCANVHHHLTHASLNPSESTSQTASRSVQPFLQLRQRVPILYNGPPLSPQNCPFASGSGPPSSTWFLGAHLSESTTQTAS